jgi:NADP-dependent alcohol dehydrogenase
MDRWAEGILKTIIEISPEALSGDNDYDSMSTFMLSATMALNGFVSMGVSQDWATHMIGHELTALLGITHGHTLTIVLPGTMWVLREEKGEKILQYGKRIFGVEGNDRDQTVKEIIFKTEKFFNSLGLKTKLSENGGDLLTIDEIERRFSERNVRFGENRSVTSKVAREILEKVL